MMRHQQEAVSAADITSGERSAENRAIVLSQPLTLSLEHCSEAPAGHHGTEAGHCVIVQMEKKQWLFFTRTTVHAAKTLRQRRHTDLWLWRLR